MTKGVETQARSVSHGTLLQGDLISAFAAELAYFKGEDDDLVREANAVTLLNQLGYPVLDDERGFMLVNNLQDTLNEHAGEGLYFGAPEGDGSDFGFWPLES